MEYQQTWKQKVTPSGIVYWAHTASALRTSGSGCTGWPTPETCKAANDATLTASGDGRQTPNKLGWAAALAGWPSPSAAQNGDTPESWLERHNRQEKRETGGALGMSLNVVSQLAAQGWNTPRATDGANGGPNQSGGALPADAFIASGWASPAARDHKDTPGMATTGVNPDGSIRNRVDQLPRQAAMASGATTTGTPAATGKPGVLNPDLSRWLMGFPAAWGCCGATAMRLSRKRPPRSSKRTSKRKEGES